ncbi:MAG: DNA mismatch repair protein MutS [Rhodospirillaceae bacterium]|nr:DNA mismatch repair protein MutS [Rhodospirillaceae bacterium]
MMAQYWSIKRENPSTLLFFRMGDFYELFFDDAVQAAAALDIALTKRGKHLGEDVQMCGVPVHAAETYLERLIRHGFKVAICEQMEDPAIAKKRGAKSIVKRGVTRIVTPGTITEDTLLDARRSNHLATLAQAQDELAVAWIEMSTGAFAVEPVDPAGLPALLERIAPAELVMPEALFDDAGLAEPLLPWRERRTPEAGARFDSRAGERRLKELFGVASLEAFGAFGRGELAAMGGLVAYVELTQKGKLPRLAPPRRLSPRQTMAIDAATRRNLELMQALDGSKKASLLGVMDRSVTGAGARLLGQRLAAPLTDPGAIAQRHDAVAVILEDRTLREDLRASLAQAPDLERALGRLALGRGGPRDLVAIREGLKAGDAIARRMSGMTALPRDLADAIAHLGTTPELVTRLEHCLIDEPPLLARDGGFVRQGENTELDEAKMLRDDSRRHIAALQSRYQSETGVNALKVRHNNMLGYYVETTQVHADKLDREIFIHRQTMANAMRFTTVELGELEARISRVADHAVSLELALFAELVEAIACADTAIAAAAGALAAIDVAGGLAELAAERNYSRPVVTTGLEFTIEQGRHPVVEALVDPASGQAFVANDCRLEDEARLWLLTGPNMAGKSTFLRQNALIAVMAQMGSFVPAAAASIGVVDRLFSRVGAADDLARGRSTFMVEMVETAAILNQASDRSLVILDEIGRGTATFDGLSIAWATLEHLHENNRCRALFATHYHELTALAARLDALKPHTMRVKEWQDDIVFLFEVGPGAADRSYGIHVAQLAGLPSAVIGRAEEVLKTIEAGEQGSALVRLADDLPLFQAVAYHAPKEAPATVSALEKTFDDIAPDELTPREALDLIYRLKDLAEGSS